MRNLVSDQKIEVRHTRANRISTCRPSDKCLTSGSVSSGAKQVGHDTSLRGPVEVTATEANSQTVGVQNISLSNESESHGHEASLDNHFCNRPLI